MSNEFEPDLIGFVDDDGKEYNFEILDELEENGRTFFALCPVIDSEEDDELAEEGEYIIMEQVMEGDDAFIAEVEDESLLDHLAEIFESHFDEMFSDEYDEDEDEEKED